MTLNPEISNIAPIPFIALAVQTQQQINDAYMRKMNRDYATSIPDFQHRIPSTNESNLEQESY